MKLAIPRVFPAAIMIYTAFGMAPLAGDVALAMKKRDGGKQARLRNNAAVHRSTALKIVNLVKQSDTPVNPMVLHVKVGKQFGQLSLSNTNHVDRVLEFLKRHNVITIGDDESVGRGQNFSQAESYVDAQYPR